MENKTLSRDVSDQAVKEYLRSQLVRVIKNKREFAYLEELCRLNKRKFGDYIINSCLDIYLEELKEDVFKAKYVALWKTAWGIVKA